MESPQEVQASTSPEVVPTHPTPARSFVMAVLVLLSILQAVFFAFTGALEARIAGIALGIASLGMMALPGKASRFRPPGLWVAAAAIIVNLGVYVSDAAPTSFRLFEAAVVFSYAAVLLAGLLTVVVRMRIENALLLSLSTALALWVVEAVVPRLTNSVEQGTAGGVTWVGTIASHPQLGDYYLPRSVMKTLYPGNPRHYFEESNPVTKYWLLDVHDPGSEATMAPGKAGNGTMRVEVTRADKPVLWHVQLREPGLALQKTLYELSFRARADARRKMVVGVSQGHGPWQNIGLYSEVDLGTEWSEFKQTFVPTSADENAQIHLDIGAVTVPVEFDNIVLRRVSVNIVPKMPSAYSVTYGFNDLGCRGNDYPIPRPPDHQRILALGDSFTLGVGVHQADTFEAKLEQSLNHGRSVKDAAAYEVINCGVSGYSTKEERLFYELIASKYQPNVVLLFMVNNDERSWRDDVRLGYVHDPGQGENEVALWRLVQTARHEGNRPGGDFRPNITEILKLQEDCERNHARLGVVFFRHEELADNNWGKLVDTITVGLQGKGIPVIDLGIEMLHEHNSKDLTVYSPIDNHPNEIAHADAAKQLEQFLRQEQLIH